MREIPEGPQELEPRLQHVSPVCEVRGVSGGRIPTSTHDAIRHPAWWDAPLRKRLQYLEGILRSVRGKRQRRHHRLQVCRCHLEDVHDVLRLIEHCLEQQQLQLGLARPLSSTGELDAFAVAGCQGDSHPRRVHQLVYPERQALRAHEGCIRHGGQGKQARQQLRASLGRNAVFQGPCQLNTLTTLVLQVQPWLGGQQRLLCHASWHLLAQKARQLGQIVGDQRLVLLSTRFVAVDGVVEREDVMRH
mmetsp:Transcript_449/g.1170  ORF Transcript_449/g.1170 Transcript_449/m.1170 type:complete len:247 (-) Transcript_449:1205-1945(-)